MVFLFFYEDLPYEIKDKMRQKLKNPEFLGNIDNDSDEDELVYGIPKKKNYYQTFRRCRHRRSRSIYHSTYISIYQSFLF